jgi:hypothetical protein
VEIEQKLEEIIERLKIKQENNLELHTIISEIDHQGEELRSAICVERKTIEE